MLYGGYKYTQYRRTVVRRVRSCMYHDGVDLSTTCTSQESTIVRTEPPTQWRWAPVRFDRARQTERSCWERVYRLRWHVLHPPPRPVLVHPVYALTRYLDICYKPATTNQLTMSVPSPLHYTYPIARQYHESLETPGRSPFLRPLNTKASA